MWNQLLKLWKSDNLLVQAWDQSYEMLEIARDMCLEAMRILRESDDTVINKDIRQKDKKVNEYEQDVRRKVMTHCTVQGPNELPGGMVLVSIVIDIERIGDYAKNILDLAEVHSNRLNIPDLEEDLHQIESTTKERFKETIRILREQDEDGAKHQMSTLKKELSLICDTIVDRAAGGKINSITPDDCAALALYARYLKRINSHLNNMVTSVANPFEKIGFQSEETKT
ncbi:MAG: PhoU domain-containing protein [Candidatus Marinimicrobia bacterium]|jgi:phosphate uptake regulator|nr:PhoU domain-containing protein [Candidatus Neomarinimicrobiota bacterium]MDP7483767.1 PhoU domain-containing protein [Candidatus Neomarinimicrobiota bacterium]MDP7715934.1 PhoU domain-containing protein [Candidatus Neomarinimicrobiota bacterium]HJM10316.1 PhoU domain-containing protein [Candidatus Neomarinimicrobiota bacterium]HJM85124.1 PhoU domain-containing protein [Candidatus Neomarinimicrobiota bacterium]|tara:strand:- start:8102 stop:8782 length:681 start_codon:yes stop_codon:yes gene_type:complete